MCWLSYVKNNYPKPHKDRISSATSSYFLLRHPTTNLFPMLIQNNIVMFSITKNQPTAEISRHTTAIWRTILASLSRDHKGSFSRPPPPTPLPRLLSCLGTMFLTIRQAQAGSIAKIYMYPLASVLLSPPSNIPQERPSIFGLRMRTRIFLVCIIYSVHRFELTSWWWLYFLIFIFLYFAAQRHESNSGRHHYHRTGISVVAFGCSSPVRIVTLFFSQVRGWSNEYPQETILVGYSF